MSGSLALDASTPAFAHTNPWRVRQMSRPGVGAHDLGRLRQHDLDVARVLAVLGGHRAAPARPGSTSASRTIRPSALETTLCAIATHVGPAPARRRRPAAPPDRPPAGSPAGPGPRAAQATAASSSSARVRTAPPGRAAEGAAQRREVVRRVDVELERARVGDVERRAGGRGERRGGARTTPRRTPAPSRPAASAAARSCPCRGGRGRSRRRRRSASSALHLGRVERRAVAGHEQHPLGAALERRRRSRARPPPTGPPRPGRGRSARRCARSRPAR